jgi:hypothetical protein
MRAFLSLVDSIMALALAILLLFAFYTQVPREAQLGLEAKVAYYKKVADQILLTSAMNGYITSLIDSFELGEPMGSVLERIVALCPGRLSCLVEVRDSGGSVLCSRGKDPIPPSGESNYFATTCSGLLRIACRVGSR